MNYKVFFVSMFIFFNLNSNAFDIIKEKVISFKNFTSEVEQDSDVSNEVKKARYEKAAKMKNEITSDIIGCIYLIYKCENKEHARVHFDFLRNLLSSFIFKEIPTLSNHELINSCLCSLEVLLVSQGALESSKAFQDSIAGASGGSEYFSESDIVRTWPVPRITISDEERRIHARYHEIFVNANPHIAASDGTQLRSAVVKTYSLSGHNRRIYGGKKPIGQDSDISGSTYRQADPQVKEFRSLKNRILSHSGEKRKADCTITSIEQGDEPLAKRCRPNGCATGSSREFYTQSSTVGKVDLKGKGSAIIS